MNSYKEFKESSTEKDENGLPKIHPVLFFFFKKKKNKRLIIMILPNIYKLFHN